MSKATAIPTVFFIGASLVVLMLGLSWQQSETGRIRMETAVTGEQIALRLQACTDARASLVVALAQQGWRDIDHLMTDWGTRAGTLYPLHDGILGLNYVSSDWYIRQVYPPDLNVLALGYDLRSHPAATVAQALNAAQRSDRVERTELVDLLQGGRGITLYKRINDPTGELLGFANGAFRLDELMDSCLAEEPLRNRFSFRILEDSGALVFQMPREGYQSRDGHAYSQRFMVIGKPWRLELSPTASYYQQQSGILPWVETGFGLLLVLALSILLNSYLRKQEQLLVRESGNAHAAKMQALGNLAGGISHDFNNILHVMMANIEFMMMDYPDDVHLQNELQSLSTTVERATALVSRLATLSRQDPVHMEVVELNGFTADLFKLLRRTLPPGIALQLDPASHPMRVQADKSQLEQLLLNICFNARDAMGERGRIAVSLRSCSANELGPEGDGSRPWASYACIRIADTGPGIPPDVLPNIFEPFFTTKQKGSGTGLGLANCYSIIKQHGGEILAESQPGSGAVFTVCLPLLDSSLPPPVDSVNGPAPGKATRESLEPPAKNRGGCVLIVDDDPEILRLTSALLQPAGYAVLTADNGEEALAVIEARGDELSLVLLDVLMPALGGLETAQRLAASHPDLPVLFMSGYAPEKDGIPPQRMLAKPFSRTRLLQAVEQNRRRTDGSTATPASGG